MLGRLAQRHDVHLLTFIDGDPDPALPGPARDAAVALGDVCASLRFVRQPMPAQADRKRFYLTRTFTSDVPPYAAVFDSAEMRAAIRERVASGVDLVQLEWTQMVQYCLPEAADRTVLTEHDIFFESLARYADDPRASALTRAIRARRAAQMRRWELGGLAKVAGIFAVSDADRDILRGLLPGARVETVPSGADVSHYAFDETAGALTAPSCPRFVFVGGMAHEPNLEGLTWFLRDAWPRIAVALPDATLDVLGGDAPDSVRILAERPVPGAAGPGVRLREFVEDTRPYLRDAISVVPIRLGAGVRIKVLEAMAAGSPIVSTSHGVSGLDVIAGEHALIADGADSLAAAAVALAGDAPRRAALARAARRLVEERYDWNVIAALQESLYERWFGGPA